MEWKVKGGEMTVYSEHLKNAEDGITMCHCYKYLSLDSVQEH
jgi:hypothetical protein